MMLRERITNRELSADGCVIIEKQLSEEQRHWIWTVENAIDENKSFFIPWLPGERVWCAIDDNYQIALRQLPEWVKPTRVKSALVRGYTLQLENDPETGEPDWFAHLVLDFGACDEHCSEPLIFRYDPAVLVDGLIGTEKSDLDPFLKNRTDRPD